jgi:hypothetical protein
VYTSVLIVSAGIFGVAILVCLLFGYNLYMYSNGKSYSIQKYTDTKTEKYRKKINKWKLKPYRGNTMMRWPSMNSENVNVLNYIVAVAMVPVIISISIPLAIYYMIIDLK